MALNKRALTVIELALYERKAHLKEQRGIIPGVDEKIVEIDQVIASVVTEQSTNKES